MESLPLETREYIASFLLDQPNYAETASVPVSSRSSRNDIYNMRLASRRMHQATIKAFTHAVEDVPTKCLPQSMQNLSSLVALPYVGHNIKSLAFETSRIYMDAGFGPLRGMNPRRALVLQQRNQWLTGKYGGELVSVFLRTPGLKHLTVIPDQMVPVEIQEGRELGLGHLTDPLECVQQALAACNIHKKPKTLKVLTNTPPNGYRHERFYPTKFGSIFLPFPVLTHMTCSAESQFITIVRFKGTNLTTLNIHLSRGVYLSFGADSTPFFDPSGKTLRNITVTAYGADVQRFQRTVVRYF